MEHLTLWFPELNSQQIKKLEEMITLQVKQGQLDELTLLLEAMRKIKDLSEVPEVVLNHVAKRRDEIGA